MELDGEPATTEQIAALALTNYGHFTTMLVDGGRVRGLSLHLRRLGADCGRLFDVELDTDRVRRYVRRALGEVSEPVVVRVTCYDPRLDVGSVGGDAEPRILVTTRRAPHGIPSPLRLRTATYQRERPDVKHVGLFGALQVRRAAQRAGYDDVALLNQDGTLSELATSNLGFVRDGRVIWPRSPWLPGVTMALLDDALDEPGLAEPVTPDNLRSLDAAFATNAVAGVRAITSIDGVTWSPAHSALRRLRDLYERVPAEKV